VCLHVCACVHGSICQVEELTAENTQLKERVALLEKLLDMKKQDGQLLNKMVDYVSFSHPVLQMACVVLKMCIKHLVILTVACRAMMAVKGNL